PAASLDLHSTPTAHWTEPHRSHTCRRRRPRPRLARRRPHGHRCPHHSGPRLNLSFPDNSDLRPTFDPPYPPHRRTPRPPPPRPRPPLGAASPSGRPRNRPHTAGTVPQSPHPTWPPPRGLVAPDACPRASARSRAWTARHHPARGRLPAISAPAESPLTGCFH